MWVAGIQLLEPMLLTPGHMWAGSGIAGGVDNQTRALWWHCTKHATIFLLIPFSMNFWMSITNVYLRKCVYLFERQSERGRGGKRKVFHLLAYSLDALNIWGWALSQAENLSLELCRVSDTGGRGSIYCLPRCTSHKQDWKKTRNTPGHCVFTSQVSSLTLCASEPIPICAFPDWCKRSWNWFGFMTVLTPGWEHPILRRMKQRLGSRIHSHSSSFYLTWLYPQRYCKRELQCLWTFGARKRIRNINRDASF